MSEESDRGQKDSEEEAPLEGPHSPEENDTDEYPIPPEQQRALIRAFSSVTRVTTPVFNPIFERFTSDHVSRIIDNTENESVRAYNASENESVREHQAETSRRRHQLIYFLVVVCVVVGLIVFFVASDNRDLITPLVAAIAGFLGGFGVGQRFRI